MGSMRMSVHRMVFAKTKSGRQPDPEPIAANGVPTRRRPTRSSQFLPAVLTVAELVALLQTLEPSSPVVLQGQYGGFESVMGVELLPLRFNVNRLEGFGPHDRISA